MKRRGPRAASNEILAGLKHDPAQGGLFYQDVRYLLIRPETLAEFQKSAEAALGFEQAGALLEAGGRTGGRLSGLRFKDALALDQAEAVRFMCSMGGQIGWGAMALIEIDPPASRLVVEVTGSPFAEAYGDSEQGVCHLIRGVFAGLAEGLFGGEVTGSETACISRGDPVCRFETVACGSA